MLKVRFFAQFREVLGHEHLELPAGFDDVGQVRRFLQQKGDLWREYLAVERSLVAVNHCITDDNAKLKADDEVAFFPPVTGG